jgi:hypothetical protein
VLSLTLTALLGSFIAVTRYGRLMAAGPLVKPVNGGQQTLACLCALVDLVMALDDRLVINYVGSDDQIVPLAEPLGLAVAVAFRARTTWTETVKGSPWGGEWAANVIHGWRVSLVDKDNMPLLTHHEPSTPDVDTAGVQATVGDLLTAWRDIRETRRVRRGQLRQFVGALAGGDEHYRLYQAGRAVALCLAYPHELAPLMAGLDAERIQAEADQYEDDHPAEVDEARRKHDGRTVTAAEAAEILRRPGEEPSSLGSVRRTLSRRGIRAVSYDGIGGAALYPRAAVLALVKAPPPQKS